jgi:hypothetical protein
MEMVDGPAFITQTPRRPNSGMASGASLSVWWDMLARHTSSAKQVTGLTSVGSVSWPKLHLSAVWANLLPPLNMPLLGVAAAGLSMGKCVRQSVSRHSKVLLQLSATWAHG